MMLYVFPEIKIAFGTLLLVLFADTIYFNKITNTIKKQALSVSFNVCYYSVYAYALFRIKYNKYIGVYYTNASKQLFSVVSQKQYNTLEYCSNNFEITQTNIWFDDKPLVDALTVDCNIKSCPLFIFTDKNCNIETGCFNKIIFNLLIKI